MPLSQTTQPQHDQLQRTTLSKRDDTPKHSLVPGVFSERDIEEIMMERGFEVDHSTIQRWVVHFSPELETAFHTKKKRPGNRWRLDETYTKVKGQ